jgi:hypothetical protein
VADTTGFKLPIFRLAPPAVNEERLNALVDALDLTGGTRQDLPEGGVRITQGSRRLDATADGAFWFADEAHLWNPERPSAPLPDPAAAEAIARAFLHRAGLVPASNDFAQIDLEVAVNSGSKTAVAMADGQKLVKTDQYAIDAYVSFILRIKPLDPITHQPLNDPATNRPVQGYGLGPATKLGVVLGAGGMIIGVNASWLGILGIHREGDFLPPVPPAIGARRLEAIGRAADPFARLSIIDDAGGSDGVANGSLVYRQTFLPDNGIALCPFWVFRVGVTHGDQTIRGADVFAPAARFPLASPPALDYVPRTQHSRPRRVADVYAAGLVWKTQYDPDAEPQVIGVLEQLQKEGWNISFRWRDADAKEADWVANAALWVDDVDLVYYSGHASSYGWVVTPDGPNPDDYLSPPDTGVFGRVDARWGRRLKWLVIAACGPMQDEFVVPGYDQNVFNWAPAFEGLHMLMGFATTTAGATGEGARMLELARDGVPLATGWLRAARESQTSDVTRGRVGPARWAAVLAAEDGDISPLRDCLPGKGYVSPDINRPTRFRAIWSPA